MKRHLSDRVHLHELPPAALCMFLNEARLELDDKAKQVLAEIESIGAEANAELEEKQAELCRARKSRRAASDGTVGELCREINWIQVRTDRRIKRKRDDLRQIRADQRYVKAELAVFEPWT